MSFLLKRAIALLALVLIAILPSLAGTSGSTARKGITAVINMQKDAWNRGDLDAFMTGYLKSPETSYTSGGEEFWGYESLQKKYGKTYGTNRDTMGTLDFTDLKIIDVSKDSAYCVGHWHLLRKDKPLAEGVFTLVFVKTASGWKIIHDHTTSGIKKSASEKPSS